MGRASAGQADRFLVRAAVAVPGIALVIAATILGTWPLAVVAASAAALAAHEFAALVRKVHGRPNEVLAMVVAAALPLGASALGETGQLWVTTAALLFAMLWLLAFREASVAGTALTLFGALYVGLLLSYMVLIRRSDDGMLLALAAIVGTWIADTAAYGVGMTVGRHKLALSISPGKTLEGTLGGLLVTVGLFAAAWFLPLASVGQRAVLGGVLGIAAATGDLVESRLKRQFEVKDSSSLIPGHGGMLDRLDSLLFVGPAVWVLLRLWGWKV